MNRIPLSPGTLEELSDLVGRAVAERLSFTEKLRLARNRIRRSNLPPLARLLYFELSFIAEDRGDFRADRRTDDLARATGMSPRSVRRHQQRLVEDKFIRTVSDGCGAGGVKGIEIPIPEETIVELSRLLAEG